MTFDVDNNTMAALCSTESKVCGF